jgi:rare lipoprotein A
MLGALLGVVCGGSGGGCGSAEAAGGGKRPARPGQTQEGKATYYDPRLAGHRTANGERYDPSAMTAAHPTLPFGTRVRVTRLDSAVPPVVVRINDRCAGKRKIIDLSGEAARRLQMLRAGRVRVRLEVVSAPPSRPSGPA